VVVNDRFDQAVAELLAILDGAGGALRADRAGLAAFVAGLLA
jgi:hypothetical protein